LNAWSVQGVRLFVTSFSGMKRRRPLLQEPSTVNILFECVERSRRRLFVTSFSGMKRSRPLLQEPISAPVVPIAVVPA
jgi:hypothetical protein